MSEALSFGWGQPIAGRRDEEAKKAPGEFQDQLATVSILDGAAVAGTRTAFYIRSPVAEQRLMSVFDPLQALNFIEFRRC
jgi:hypothetical protein